MIVKYNFYSTGHGLIFLQHWWRKKQDLLPWLQTLVANIFYVVYYDLIHQGPIL